MRGLGQHGLETLPNYSAIARAKAGKRRDRLAALEPFVSSRYSEYEARIHNLSEVSASRLQAEAKSDLVHCYDAPTAPLRLLKVKIYEYYNSSCAPIVAMCQYCGLSYNSSGWDHYLPKAKFPEFSVLSLNLVPCCSRCNDLKGDSWLDESGARTAVSLYYDDLPTQQYLHASVDMAPGPVAKYWLSSEPAVFGGLEDVIRNHYSRLRLLNRYQRAAPEQFSEIHGELGPLVRLKGVSGGVRLLRKKADRLSISHSVNYWKVPLLQAMASNESYLASLLV